MFLGLLILAGLGIACSATATPTTGPDLDATVTASLKTSLPQRTSTPRPDVYQTVQAQGRETQEAEPTPTTATDETPIPTLNPISETIVERVRPSVVRIVSNRGVGTGFIFQMGYPRRGVGDTALVMTNYHFIENAGQINVTINDLTTLTGTVVGIDRFHDLAVLSICCGQFKPLSIVDVDDPAVGSSTAVLAYATGVSGEATVTEDVVSESRYENGQWIIETGESINAGRTGGPLISSTGALLGLNTYKPGESSGFAISQKTLQERIPDLLSGDLLAEPTATPRPTATPTSLSHQLEGERLFDIGLFDSAIVEFNQAIIGDRDFSKAFAWRGRSNLELGNFRDAIADISQAIIADETVVDYYRWRGESYTALKIYTQAIPDYAQVIARDPIPTADDYHAVGFARFKNGDYWQAIEDFTEAILLEATAERFELRGASYYQSAGDILTEQFWAAISDFNQAIRLGATGGLYQQRGNAYDKLGEDIKAAADWTKACDLDLALC